MDPVSEFTIQIEQVKGFEFRVNFDKPHYTPLHLDEPAPLGTDVGPSPARILAAAMGDCLAASLVFCLQRRGVAIEGLKASVHVELVRNERKRLRIGPVKVALHPSGNIPPDALAACVQTFEDFCVVTQSVREGIDVQVSVVDPSSQSS